MFINLHKILPSLAAIPFICPPFSLANISSDQNQEILKFELAQDYKSDINNKNIANKIDLITVKEDLNNYFILKRKGFVDIKGPDI